MKYNADIQYTRTIYIYVLLWKLKKNGTKKRGQLDWKAFFLFI